MTLRTNLALGGAIALLFLLPLDGRAQPALVAPPPEPPPPASGAPDLFPPIPPSAPPSGPSGALPINPFLVDALTGPMMFRGDYRAAWYPDVRVLGQNTNLGMVREDVSLNCPLWQGRCDGLSLSLHATSEQFHTHAILPDTGQLFPDDLWALALANYRHQFDNGWIAGGGVSVGSASDRPFHSIDEMTASVNAFLRVPSGEHNAWLFTLAYSTNSELPIPIPGVAYVWQPSDNFRANIGLPFQIMYRPIDDLTLDLSYMLLTTVHAQATYRLQPGLCAYTSFDWRNESYFLANRPDNNDRFFYYEKKLTAGVRWTVSPHVTFDLSGGYAFDRFYFEGLNYNDRNKNRIDVGDAPFVGAQVHVRW